MAKKNAARSSQVVPVTPEGTLVSLLNSAKRAKGKVADINEEVRTSVSNAVDNKHLHRKAFNSVKSAFPMTDEKLAEWHHHLMYYLDASGINERVEKVGRLPLDDDDTNVVELKSEAAAAVAAE